MHLLQDVIKARAGARRRGTRIIATNPCKLVSMKNVNRVLMYIILPHKIKNGGSFGNNIKSRLRRRFFFVVRLY